MRISDWSSDVCSSDLLPKQGAGRLVDADVRGLRRQDHRHQKLIVIVIFKFRARGRIGLRKAAEKVEYPVLVHGQRPRTPFMRSDERRVGKECVITCRAWGSRDN